MATSTRTRKSAAVRKAEVVSAALDLADQLGPDRVTTETLANSVGLTHPGLFRHFPKKLSIWEAVADYIGEQMEKRWARAEQSDASTPEARLRRLVLAQLRLIRTFPAIPAILFSRELQVENDRLRKVFVALMQRFHQRLTGNIIAAQDAGVFRDDFD
ncbi:MAG: TetR family transcriptional regulator, partial [Wenzhouxiangellaceae bacterium]